MKKVLGLISLVVVVAVVASLATWWVVGRDTDDDAADDGAEEATSSSPTATESASGDSGDAREAPEDDLQTFYDQQVEWSSCGQNECGTIEVPLDYDDPTGKTIELALLKNPADSPEDRVGSLVVNPGGPGAPGTDYADQAGMVFGEALNDSFDIVGFDPRGTGASAPVDCLSDEDLTDYLASDPDPDTQQEVQEFRQWSLRMGKGCVAKSGDLAAHVSTVEAARDMDVIRAVLEEEKLAYFGASYGTKLGATYADLFPERSGRLVLDGAVDVSLDTREMSLQQAAGFQTALEAYVEDCLSGDCYLGDSKQEALQTIRDFLDQVDEKPLDAGNRKLYVGDAFYGIVLPLYSKDYWMLLDSALEDGLNGDGSALLRLADLYASRSGGTYTDNSSEAIWAINCLDDPSYTPVKKIPQQFDDFEKASPTFGKVFAWGLAGCEGLQVDPPKPRAPLTASGADPMLVIGTTRDPATPMRWAEALADQLEPAILVRRDGDGHTGYNQGNDCVDDVVEAYLIEGEVPDDDVSCPA